TGCGARYPRRPSSEHEAIEVSTILLEVLLRVGKIGLTLLEERFRLPEREPEEPFHLAACQRPFTVPLYGDGLEGTSGHITPCELQALRDVLGQLQGDLHVYVLSIGNYSRDARGTKCRGGRRGRGRWPCSR